MAEAVIFIGLQGAGKTTYFKQHFAGTHQHISRDLPMSAQGEASAMAACFAAGRSFVLDDTNTAAAGRSATVKLAKAAGFRVVCYFFDVPVRTAIGRNNHRKDKKPLPVPAILRSAKALQPPTEAEGFDEIKVIKTEDKAPATGGR